MFQSLLIKDWTHQLAIPIQHSLPVANSIVDIQEGITISASKIQVLDEEVLEDNIESRFSIEIESKSWLLQLVQRVLDTFSDEDSRQFVGASFSLKLALVLISVPESDVVVPGSLRLNVGQIVSTPLFNKKILISTPL